MADEIFIRCKGPEQVHWVTPRAVEGSLAITPWLNNDCTWDERDCVITHIPTGLKLHSGGYSFDDAMAFLKALNGLPVKWGDVRKDNVSDELANAVRETRKSLGL